MKSFEKYLLLFLLWTHLILFAKPYKGAELRSIETFTYGRFEARFKPPRGDGFLASFFTYHPISDGSEWNEIDIEILGRYDDNVQFTTITPGHAIYDSHHYVPFNPNADFHIYCFEWTPEYVAWFVDGVEWYRQTGDHIATLNLPQKIMMNIWIPEYENWVGKWDDRQLPKFARYDWVSYAAYTPGTGDTGSGDNFTFQWKDDFDSLNAERWETASHTWSGNLVDMEPRNVVFQDGIMILCLTDEANVGYVDNEPPFILWARGRENLVELYFSEQLDSLSASSLSNYYIAGLEIQSVEPAVDQRTIRLIVSSIDTSKNYSIAVLGIQDASEQKNKQIGQVVPIAIGVPLSFPVKINAGGKARLDYLPDQAWSPLVEYGHLNGRSREWSANIDIGGTEQDFLFRSELSAAVKYNIRVPNGIYDVVLYFAENEFSQSGQRLFDIVIEDHVVERSVDLVAVVGQHQAYSSTVHDIVVRDGVIDIHLHNWIERSLLNGVIVEKKSSAVTRNEFAAPPGFLLPQNYPNPFNPETTIPYNLKSNAYVELLVYNLAGQRVATLVSEEQEAGNYAVVFNATTLPNGVYVYRLRTNHGGVMSRKMLILK